MQIVIDIPEEKYQGILNMAEEILDASTFCSPRYLYIAVLNGTPLPKGYGRLKDVDAFLSKVKADREHSAYVISWTADDVLNALNNSYAPTIIEADETESENME